MNKTKSKRVNDWLIEGKGMIAHGYWVDFNTTYSVRQIFSGVFEWTKFYQVDTDDYTLQYAIEYQRVYTDTDLLRLLDDMRKIAPLSRWHEHTQHWDYYGSYGDLLKAYITED